MQINPKEIVEKGILKTCEFSKIGPNGIDCTCNQDLKIWPGKFVNIEFNETVDVPEHVIGIVYIRSSYARIGCLTSQTIFDSGYSGTAGTMMHNLTDKLIEIPKNTRVAQMVFYRGESNAKYDGVYKDATSVHSKLEKPIEYKKEKNER